MNLLEQFDLPGSLPDLDDWPNRKAQWGASMSGPLDSRAQTVDLAWATHSKSLRTPLVLPEPYRQIYNPLTQDVKGPLFEQAITWNAFPLELLRRFGRARALVEADRLWPIRLDTQKSLDQKVLTERATRNSLFFRPQSEYCEWRVDRDPGTGRMRRVTFTSEIADYWTYLFGADGQPLIPNEIMRSRRKVLALYRELADRTVQAPSLLLAPEVKSRALDLQRDGNMAGQYNIFNEWNTTRGIVHLSCPANRMGAALDLLSDSTYLYANASNRLLTYPEAICGAIGQVSLNRHSDLAVAGSVNALVRHGMMVTLANPPGIYIDHIDTSSWQLPGGIPARACWEVKRGNEDNIVRLVVRMPPKSGYTLSDLNIAGEPLLYGGQLAECVTVRLMVAAASLPQGIVNPMVLKSQTNLVTSGNHQRIVSPADGPAPVGASLAFAGYNYPAPPRPQ